MALGALLLFFVVIGLLYFLLATSSGSRLLIEKIAHEANISLRYSEGTLYRGVAVSEVRVAQGEEIEVYINQGYVKLGFAALLARQVHLSALQVDTVTVVNHKPPSDDPFAYPSIDLPVNLWLQNVSANQVIYKQASKDPISVAHLRADSATWYGTKVSLDHVGFALDDTLTVADLRGDIDLQGDYPLTAKADLSLNSLQKHHVSTLQISADGSLKHTHGQVVGQYNGADVAGRFRVQGVDDDSPFWADISYEQLAIPYATDENIILHNGRVIAEGVVSAIELRLNTELSANTIPNGHYFGRALMNPPSDGMTIQALTAVTADGTLQATGQLDWRDDFAMQATIKSDDYQLAYVLPDAYSDYGVYLPKRLDGVLTFAYDSSDDHYRLDLEQKDGETLAADIKKSANGWDIDANWQQLKRTLPMGLLDSPSGQVKVQTTNAGTHIDAQVMLSQFASLPKGDYRTKALLKGQRIDIDHANYEGMAGQLSADGVVMLADDNNPLSYELALQTPKLIPAAFGVTAVDYVAGKTHIKGQMDSKGRADQHQVQLDDTDLTAHLPNQSIRLLGSGQVAATLAKQRLTQLDASVSGTLLTTGLAKGLARNDISAHITGNTEALTIDKLTLAGDSGHLSAAGVLQLNDGIRWRGNVRADGLQLGDFIAQTTASISGDLSSSGHYQHGRLQSTDIDFVGSVAQAGQRGDVQLSVTSDGDKHSIQRLAYAGQLLAKGFVDIKRNVLELDATLADFDIGQLIQGRSSRLSGALSGAVKWGGDRQHIDISTLDISGVLDGHQVLAKGALMGEFALPKDIKGLFAQSDKTAHRLADIKATLAAKQATYERLVKRLQVDELLLHIGDNRLAMTGNEQKLHLNINATSLSQLMPTMRGQVVGGLVLVQSQAPLPTVYGDLSINNVSMPNFAMRQGSLLAKVADTDDGDSSLVAQAVGVVAFGRNLKQVRLDAKGSLGQHAIGLFVNDGNLQAEAQLQGGFVDGRYQGVLSDGRLQTPQGEFFQQQPSELSYHTDTRRLALAAHCWQTNAKGKLCLQENLLVSPSAGHVNLVADGIDSAVFRPLLPKDLQIDARLHGAIKASWQAKQAPKIDALLYADNGTVGVDDTTMQFERLSLLAQSVAEGLRLRGDLKAGQAGKGYVDVVIDPTKTPKPLHGELAISQLNLAVVRPLFPALTALAGEVNIGGQVSGTLSKPLFEGQARLSDGQLAAAGVPVALQKMTIHADIHGTQADLTGNFASGDGVGTLAGQVDWRGDLQAKVDIQGERLALANPPLVTATISPHIQVIVRPQQKYVDIKGVITVPSATIRPPQANQQVVGLSDDVVVLDRRMSSDALALLADVAPWSINADVGVDLGEAVVFRGFGANLPLAGALHLTQQGQGTLQAKGLIQVAERTTVDAVGQNLELNYAQVRFNGDIKNPRLSIEAVRELSGQTVGVRVTDRVSKPVITVFNDAGLSQQQAMNALVTGKLDEGSTQISEQGFRSQVTNNLAAAGLSLGLRGTRNITNDLGHALGLQSLVVDASGNSDDTQVNVTGYISPDLYIRYGVGVFNAESSLSMRYQLTRRIYVQATSAAERIVDVVYRWQF